MTGHFDTYTCPAHPSFLDPNYPLPLSHVFLQCTHSDAFVTLVRRFIHLEETGCHFSEMQYNQVLQAVLLAQFEAREGRVTWRPEVDLPEAVVDKALAAWTHQQTETQLSGFHLDVSEGLKRLGLPHKIEYLMARDLLSVDIAIIQDGEFQFTFRLLRTFCSCFV
jgi:hypothetical protein